MKPHRSDEFYGSEEYIYSDRVSDTRNGDIEAPDIEGLGIGSTENAFFGASLFAPEEINLILPSFLPPPKEVEETTDFGRPSVEEEIDDVIIIEELPLGDDIVVTDLKFSEEDRSDKNFGGRFFSKTGTGKTTVTSPTLSYSTSYRESLFLYSVILHYFFSDFCPFFRLIC